MYNNSFAHFPILEQKVWDKGEAILKQRNPWSLLSYERVISEQYNPVMFAVKTFTSALATRLEKSFFYQCGSRWNAVQMVQSRSLQESIYFYRTTNHLSESPKNKNKISNMGEAYFKH